MVRILCWLSLPLLHWLKPFHQHLSYHDPYRLSRGIEENQSLTLHPGVESIIRSADINDLQALLSPSTELRWTAG